ncbi:MAG: hypothetical protein EZS28_012007 [Streblomastix strix]|uniref:Uncharacterized protein n=1 Tax=Streblomastix strix TaxID=222440 RepID=A0A5J4WBZ5_9EUKA|nr:MAG: hypothetical protein EZS28_012007 [Streblomastix strix]
MWRQNGETLTKLLVHKSHNEFADLTAYSLTQIDVSHNFIESFHMANQLNGPQIVENPSQTRSSSPVTQCYVPVVLTSGSYVISSFALQLTADLAVGSPATASADILFNCISNVFACIFIVQFTQQVLTIVHVTVPLAAGGAREYLISADVN